MSAPEMLPRGEPEAELPAPAEAPALPAPADEPAEREPMLGGGWLPLFLLIFLTALGFGAWWGVQTALARGWLAEARRNYSEVSLLPGPLIRAAEPDLEIQIYYPVRGQALDYRTYKLRRAPSGDAERVDLIRETLNNPAQADRFRSPLPGKTTLRAAYILDGIVWLDLSKDFRDVEDPSPLRERLAVYALVNTFLLNIPDLQGARVMIDGQPVETAWGWLDLGSPLGVNLSLIG